ncbi:hypothetical protein HDZ31DRAFT_61787 [Schizophyllum fasciatum]
MGGARVHVWFDSRRLCRGVVGAVEGGRAGGRAGGGWADERCVDGRRVWEVFLAGLARVLACGDTQMGGTRAHGRLKLQPSRALRPIPEWHERFCALQPGMGAAADTTGDPVTVGGAVGAMSAETCTLAQRPPARPPARLPAARPGSAGCALAMFRTGDAPAQEALLTWCAVALVRRVRAGLRMPEQAVCAFVGMHRECVEGAGAGLA